jgi:long-chain acyl-CoA synthetase
MNVNLAGILERSARYFGDRPVVVDGNVRLTYREMAHRVAAFDTGLRRLGVKQGEVVAMLMLNSHRHLELWFSIPRGGAVINDLNIRLAPAELSFILADSDAVVLVVDDAFAPLGIELAQTCPTVRTVVYAGDGEAPEGTVSYETVVAANLETAEPMREVPEETLAGIFYTGGTTGLPKGAMLTHRSLTENAKHVLISWGYQDGDIYLHAAPMFHLGDGASTFAVTAVGGRHVIIPAFDAELAMATIEAEGVTRALLVPTMLNLMVNHPDVTTRDLSSLRRVFYGASPMPDDLLQQVMTAIDCCEWAQAYGMTEASPLVSVLPAEDHARGRAGEEPHASRLKSAGRPVFGVEVSIRRPDGSEAEPGEPGEIWVRGPNLLVGYWKRPEETEAALVADGWYRSGDAAYMDADGYLYIVDRLKDMIISGGENVYSTEVENVLFGHSAVLETAVFGVPDERWGERVHAAVVLHAGAEVSETELIEYCRQRIAGYKMPRSVEFHADALPKSGAGKILKRDLRQPHWEHLERGVS